jgi:hypothetical protein
MACSIDNIGECIVEKLFGFVINLINISLQPFLDIIYKLLAEPVNISVFSDVWQTIVYILSMFYGLLLIYIGFKFILSGENPVQREKAKSSLKNTLIMVVLVQISYYLYSLIIILSSALTKLILNITGNNFFTLSSEGITNIGLELIFLGVYLGVLIITSLILILRYIFVSIGIIFFTIGIFLYFIEPLKEYGKLILNILLALIFLPFVYSLMFLACSRLLDVQAIQNIKILIMIGAFCLIIISTVIAVRFVIIKAAMKNV